MDRPRFAFRGLDKALILLGCSCLLTLVSDSFFLAMAFVLMGMAVDVILKSDNPIKLAMPNSDRSDARQKGRKLKEAVAANHLYEDAELTLTTLALKLAMHPHELSRIINVGLDKNFSDFINEFRVREIARKMRDPAYDRLTLLGIAYESGFNSKTTFNRVFKQMTGKTPVDYKNSLKKEVPIDELAPPSPIQPLLLRSGSPPTRATDILNRTIASVHPLMLRNYFKIALRSFWRNKAFSAINMLGLALGLTCSLLIFLWVRDELRVDHNHANGPQLYRILERQFSDGKRSASPGTPWPLTLELPRKFPEVVQAAGFSWPETLTFTVNNHANKETGNWAGANWFDMFSIPLLAGTAQTALTAPNSLAISRKLADTYFGSPRAAIGKAIQIDHQQTYQVTAVFENIPANSSETYDFLLPWSDFDKRNGWARDWSNSGPRAYVQLRPDADVAAFSDKLKNFLWGYNKDIDLKKLASYNVELFLQPFEEIYLHSETSNGDISGGRIEYVRLFSVVAIFLLLIACINFMNLATARSAGRAKEVGIRKVVGAGRSRLIGQFIGEALLLTLLSMLVALLLIALLLPSFNQLTGKHIALPFAELDFGLALVGILLATSLLAGSYPALFLSSLQPVRILKGSLKFGAGATHFRQGLVVVQFVISILLMVGTIVVYRQVHFIQTKNLGFDRDNLIYVPFEGGLASNYAALKQDLLTKPGIQAVSHMDMKPTFIGQNSSDADWRGKDPTVKIRFTHTAVGYDIAQVMKARLLEGREFSKAFSTDSAGYLINEQAARRIGYRHPVGQPLSFWKRPGKIIGVIQDFHYSSLHDPIAPLIIRLDEQVSWGNLLVRVQPGQTKQALASLEMICKQYNPTFPFTYSFADQEYQALYKSEQIIGTLVNYFAVLAMFIACLGLFGLASFTAEQRRKEIGVRKVLGASVGSVVGLLSGDFLKLVVLAIVLALPLSWYLMRQWLQGYAYKTELSWWLFGVAGLVAIGVALLTVSYQSLKAALMNPVKSLQSE
ncbi:ABC transporter permease [Spirosoma endbachense]|nr:ABC transporter permease [Spirosoma endbachense]